jgi:hypothetical protein
MTGDVGNATRRNFWKGLDNIATGSNTLMRMQALAEDRGGVPELLIRNVRRSVATGGKPDIAQKARTGSD